MNEYTFFGNFAGVQLHFSFRHPDTADYFNGWLSSAEPANISVRIPASDCECWLQEYGMKDDGNTEFGMSVYRASDALLPFGCCVFHAAAMLWRRKAWLFAAVSGTGKSTQLRLWKELYGDDVQILNGDKPILRFESSGEIIVHGSPWKGKEEWGDDSLYAPLGGIILLKQGMSNRVNSLRPVQGNARLMGCFFSAFENEDTVHRICSFLEILWNRIPVWELENIGDFGSVQLTKSILEREL